MAEQDNLNQQDISEEVAAPQQEATEPEEAKGGKKKRTPEQKKRARIIGWSIAGGIVGIIVLFVVVIAIINPVGVKALMKQAESYEKVAYTDSQLAPPQDADGYYSFTTDGNFEVIQLTDVHIGAGFMSQQKDAWAMNAVATMVRQSQPDLVVVTGDIAYPVPFQSGTFNNMNAAKIFATEMESLGVYWTFAFGNHDTEAYSRYTRKQICDWYAAQDFKYCLFSANNDIADKDEAEEFGYGNNIIKVKNTAGVVTQALVTFDSHSYTDGDIFGALWKYDNIHQNQIDWYAAEMGKLQAANTALGYADPIKNLAFFHIPLREYRDAWKEYEINGFNNTANVQKIYGVNGEEEGASQNPLASNAENPYGVFCGVYKEELDGKLWAAGKANGLQGTFCGHDHINNFSLQYNKDGASIRLTYGMSVDYLAYAGIFKQHAQRGCTAITVHTDGSFDCAQRNYYTDFEGVAAEAGDLKDVE